ncbi:MAG: hypothetical protein ACJ8F7_08150 [Gemmataceae bacterium]
MRTSRMLTALVLAAAVAAEARAVVIANFKSLDDLIDKSDAVLVVRIDRTTQPVVGPDLYTTHECFVYATLKGKAEVGQRVSLQLLNAGRFDESRFGVGSTYIVFLRSGAAGTGGPTYWSIQVEGATIPVAPDFREKTVKGKTAKEAVKALVREYIEYRDRKTQKQNEFFEKLLK